MIDASNLHVGGGVHVAASVINEICAATSTSTRLAEWWKQSVDVVVSSEVEANLETGAEERVAVSCRNSRPGRWAEFPKRHYGTALTVFGPHYRRRIAELEIVGFALPRMIIPPASVGLERPSPVERVLNTVRWRRFGKADVVVTETEVSAERVRQHLPGCDVKVIPSAPVVAIAALDRDDLRVVTPMRFAVVARDYPHKNLGFLQRLGPALSSELGQRVAFNVTLSESEWTARSDGFRAWATNYGVIPQDELPDLYRASVATVLPTLLEVASATPLDSMALGVPVFISDLPFLHETYGNAVEYFDPFDEIAASKAIAGVIKGGGLAAVADRGMGWARSLPTARSRALRYVELLLGEELKL